MISVRPAAASQSRPEVVGYCYRLTEHLDTARSGCGTSVASNPAATVAQYSHLATQKSAEIIYWNIGATEMNTTITLDPERQALFESCQPMVLYFARHLARRQVAFDYEDAVSEGYVGLMQAVNSFSQDRGVQFSTFALHRVRGAMLDALRRSAPACRRRRRQGGGARPGDLSGNASTGGEGESVSQPATAATPGASLRSNRQIELCSLDEILEASELPAGEADPTPNIALQELQGRSVRDLIAELPDRERAIVYRHYLLGEKHAEIAQRLKLSESRISQLHRSALNHLRLLAEDHGGEALAAYSRLVARSGPRPGSLSLSVIRQ